MAQRMATLINPTTRERRPVAVGSSEAQRLFGQGYVLEQSPGVPTSTTGSSLTGTLPPERTLPEEISTFTPSRTLPEEGGSMANFQFALQQMAREAYSRKPTIAQVLERYGQAGVPLTTPSAIGGALTSDVEQRAGRIMDVYNRALNVIKEQETSKQNLFKLFGNIIQENPSFFSEMSPEDLQLLQRGVVSNETMARLGQFAQQAQTEELDTQVVEAGGRSLLINKRTGETIRDLGYAYKGTGDGEKRIPGKYSGKFSEDELARRFNDIYDETTGTIDYIELDRLQNVNTDLWLDMNIFLNNILSEQIQEQQLPIYGPTYTPSSPQTLRERLPELNIPGTPVTFGQAGQAISGAQRIREEVSQRTPQIIKSVLPQTVRWLFE